VEVVDAEGGVEGMGGMVEVGWGIMGCCEGVKVKV
jgi:hypothetical protein